MREFPARRGNLFWRGQAASLQPLEQAEPTQHEKHNKGGQYLFRREEVTTRWVVRLAEAPWLSGGQVAALQELVLSGSFQRQLGEVSD